MTKQILAAENISKLYRIGVPDVTAKNSSNPLLRAILKPLANFRKYRSLYSFTEAELSGAAQTP
jgi:hypothetical protein